MADAYNCALNINEATEVLRAAGMRINAETLRKSIEQKVYDFGVCLRGDSSREFWVFPAPLDEWLHWAFRKRLLDVAPGHIRQRIADVPEGGV